MNKGVIAGLILSGLCCAPLNAQPMTQAQCDRAWLAFIDILGETDEDHAIEQTVNPQGWCAMIDGGGKRDTSKFREAQWRADGIEDAIARGVPPVRFQAVLDGVDVAEVFDVRIAAGTTVKPGALALIVTHDPETRRGLLEEFKADLGGLGEISVLAAARNINFSDKGSMMVSFGSARLEEVHFELRNTGFIEKALMPRMLFSANDMQISIAAFAKTLPPETIDGDSLRALEKLSASLPDAKGRLRVVARSKNGLGIPQIAMSLMRLENQKPTVSATTNEGLELLLDGVTLEISWSPDP